MLVAASTCQILHRSHPINPAMVYLMRQKTFRIPATFGGGKLAGEFHLTVTLGTGICIFLVVLLPLTAVDLKASLPLNATSKSSSLTLTLLISSLLSAGLFLLVFLVFLFALFSFCDSVKSKSKGLLSIQTCFLEKQSVLP